MTQDVVVPVPDVRAALAAALDLDVAELGPDDDLFALGLDSLAVIRLAAGWRRDGYAVTFEELAEDPTASRWEALLAARARAAAPPAPPADQAAVSAPQPGDPARRVGAEGEPAPFALAPMQHAYWVGRQEGQPFGGVGSHFYLEFDGRDVDPRRLQAAYDRLVDRHDMLRARFTGDGRQWIADRAALDAVDVHDLRRLDPAACGRRLADLRERRTHRRFDVERGEVFELALSLLPGGATRLHVDLDMMAGDALSLSVLLDDLARLVADPDAPLPALGYDVRTYLADRAAAAAARRERDAAWWSSRIPDLPGGPGLPTRPDAGRAAPRMLRLHHHLDADDAAALTAAARRHGLTPAAALAAAFAEVVGAWSASPRFVLNLPLFDREPLHPDVDRLVGDFTGSVLLDVDLGSAPRAFAAVARDVQSRLHAAVGHGGFGGVDVLRELARRGSGRSVALTRARTPADAGGSSGPTGRSHASSPAASSATRSR